MLKLKKTIRNPKNKSQNDDLTELQNDSKNHIKMLYISNQKKKKAINEYAELFTKFRNEYTKLQKENNEIKIKLHRYQNYFQNMSQKWYQKPSYTSNYWEKESTTIKNELEQSEEIDSYVTEIRSRPKKQKKRIIYEDEIDGIPEYEPDSPNKEEQEDDNNYEIQSKHRGKQPNKTEKPKKVKKGITRSIKL